MREIELYFDDNLATTVIKNLQPEQAAQAANHFSAAGEYRIACTLLQLAAALAAATPPDEVHEHHPEAHDAPGQAAHAVQFTRGARDGREVAGTELAATAVIPLVARESHAPTACVYPIGTPCGELIRWSEANGWYHVNDGRLGASAHPATPGP